MENIEQQPKHWHAGGYNVTLCDHTLAVDDISDKTSLSNIFHVSSTVVVFWDVLVLLPEPPVDFQLILHVKPLKYDTLRLE